ncbi:hypothetical protein RSOL_490990 [Rhizoctonia solani AG-3 Rhs1AP]|uniref:Uncharacterized protein n=2 Tax=Rhizoctonia solani AG-3 TaxID=1086053 RepID=A0A074SWS1_9AGAM|nr:hypothetical protein RSOL_490990 [Rhizoctonia solani AG-3 Rhs1AP]KEP54307.1 hypothetical protein V565_019410 [Rhizoctonia solani 123E]
MKFMTLRWPKPSPRRPPGLLLNFRLRHLLASLMSAHHHLGLRTLALFESPQNPPFSSPISTYHSIPNPRNRSQPSPFLCNLHHLSYQKRSRKNPLIGLWIRLYSTFKRPYFRRAFSHVLRPMVLRHEKKFCQCLRRHGSSPRQ